MLDLFSSAEIKADRQFISKLPELAQFELREAALNDLADEVVEEFKTLRYDHNQQTLTDCLARLRDPLVVLSLQIAFGVDAEVVVIAIESTVSKNKNTQPPGKGRAAGGGRKKKNDLSNNLDLFGVSDER